MRGRLRPSRADGGEEAPQLPGLLLPEVYDGGFGQ